MMFIRTVKIGAAISALAGAISYGGAALAQTPKQGGSVVVGFEGGDPTNFDCHATTSTNVLAFTAPHYSLLLRYDVTAYPRVEGDLAESWAVSADGLSYTFKLRPGVKFHDGSPLTAADIKATYERIRNPPAGVVSIRKDEFSDVTTIDVMDASTIVFRLSQPNAAMLTAFANPFNCVYSARRLAESQAYPLTNIMGSGPFVPGEYVKGASWTGKKFNDYFRPGRPYLDEYRMVIISPTSGPTAFSGGQIDLLLRNLQPQEIDNIKSRRGDKAAFSNVQLLAVAMVLFNTQRKPFDDERVRRALTLAIDRKGGLGPITAITNMMSLGPIVRPGSEMALSAAELAKLPGFGDNIASARVEARRLLSDAGQGNLKFSLLTRTTSPFSQIGIFAVDQWRQIGLTVDMNPVDTGPYVTREVGGDFDAVIDIYSMYADDPSSVLTKYLPGSSSNFGRYADPVLTDLFQKQKVTLDTQTRRNLVNQFEIRTLQQAYVAPMYWAGWTSVTASNVHGWSPTPIFFVGYDMGNIWRD